MTDTQTPRTLRGDDTLWFFLWVFLCFHVLSVSLTAMGLLSWIAGWEQWALLAVPTLLFVKVRGVPMRDTLRLHPLGGKAIWLSVVFGVGMIGAGIVLTSLQDQLLMNFEWYQARMAIWKERLTASIDQPLLWLILTVAITPAVCEELAFRGVVITAASKDLPVAGVCVVSGVLFGLFHGDPVQLVLTALIGGGLAWLVIATGSVLAGIIAHFMFNVATLLLRHFVDDEPMQTITGTDWLLLALIALGSAALISLSAKGLLKTKSSPAVGTENAMGVNNT